MLVDQAGAKWIFCRGYAGSAEAAETFDKISELQPLARPKLGEHELNMWNFQVVCEGETGFRMIFDDFGAGIYTMTSRDGLVWGDPRPLVEDNTETAAPYTRQLDHPCLIPSDGRPLLMYRSRERDFLTPIDLEGPPIAAGQGVQVSYRVAPIASRTPFVHDGKVFLIAGESTAWLLEADLKSLSVVPPATQGAKN